MFGTASKKILLYAFGNPGRGDDGLGNAFIVNMEKWIREKNFQHITTDSSYQLNIEDALTISRYDIIIFIDASIAEIDFFSFSPVFPVAHSAFTTHSVSSDSLLALCTELYGAKPLVYLLQIKGYDWEFGDGLSAKAEESLQKAVNFMQKTVMGFQNQE